MRYPLIFPDAMVCRSYCINLGEFTDGQCYLDRGNLLCVSSSVWEIHIDGYTYSCHVKQSSCHFEKSYQLEWGFESNAPKEFNTFVQEAYLYDHLNYPQLSIIVDEERYA